MSFIIEAPALSDFSAISLLKVSTDKIVFLNDLEISLIIGITLSSSSLVFIIFKLQSSFYTNQVHPEP
jgi:cell division protein FtsL